MSRCKQTAVNAERRKQAAVLARMAKMEEDGGSPSTAVKMEEDGGSPPVKNPQHPGILAPVMGKIVS